MALTDQEESKIRTLLNAFDGAQKINDLPLASGGLEDYTVEVQDKTGESARLNLYNAISVVNQKIAIRRWNRTLSTSAGEAYGNLDFLRELPSVLRLGCYLVTDDRQMRKLDPTNHYKFADGSPAKLDGSQGQYMFAWGVPFYVGSWSEGNYDYLGVSLSPIDGAECYYVPVGGSSALGNGVVDRTNALLCSVINTDPQYRGGNNNAAYDGTYRSFLGLPASAIAYHTFSAYARKRGEGWEANWFTIQSVLEILFLVIMGNRHSQTAFNPNRDENGLYQGGLGVGLTDVSSANWSAYNGYYGMVPTSVGVELGDGVGVSEYNILNQDGSTFHTAKIPVFFGLKNLYGNLWRAVRGLLFNIATPESKVYVAPSMYAGIDHTSLTGLIEAAVVPQTEGYIKRISHRNLCNCPTEIGASSTTFFADYFYTNTANNSGIRCRLSGGSSYNGAAAGAFISHSNAAPTGSDTNVSAPLCFSLEDPSPVPIS